MTFRVESEQASIGAPAETPSPVRDVYFQKSVKSFIDWQKMYAVSELVFVPFLSKKCAVFSQKSCADVSRLQFFRSFHLRLCDRGNCSKKVRENSNTFALPITLKICNI